MHCPFSLLQASFCSISFDVSNYVDVSLSCLKYQLLGVKVILSCSNSLVWKSMQVDFQFRKMLSTLN